MGGRKGKKDRTLRGFVTLHFYASLNHKNTGQTKFIKPNSQR